MESDPTYEYAMVRERNLALKMIAELPATRRGNSFVKLTGWRRVIRGIDESKRDADRFVGEFLEPGDDVHLREGAIVVQYNSLCVNAKLFKRDWDSITPRSQIFIAVYQVTQGELVKAAWDVSRAFKTWDKKLSGLFSDLCLDPVWPPYLDTTT